MDALNRHRECSFVSSNASLTHYLPVRSEGGQDCQKAQDEAQANGLLNSGNGMGPPDSAGSFVAMDINDMSSIVGDYRGGVKAEPDNWMSGGVLM